MYANGNILQRKSTAYQRFNENWASRRWQLERVNATNIRFTCFVSYMNLSHGNKMYMLLKSNAFCIVIEMYCSIALEYGKYCPIPYVRMSHCDVDLMANAFCFAYRRVFPVILCELMEYCASADNHKDEVGERAKSIKICWSKLCMETVEKSMDG